MQLGPAEILVVLIIALLVFGPSRLPDMARQVGRAVRELKKFQHSISSDMGSMFSEDHSEAATPAPSLPPLKTGAKKTGAKKTVKKKPTKKSGARKTGARKTVKKKPTKKSGARKTVARKTVARKSVARKPGD